jgi:hypothetical protein
MSKTDNVNEEFDRTLGRIMDLQKNPDIAAAMLEEMEKQVRLISENVVEHFSDDPSAAISSLSMVIADLVRLSPLPELTLAVHVRSVTMLTEFKVPTRFIQNGPGNTIQNKPRQPPPPLTREQRDLLEWLGSTEYSQLGECHGAALDALVARGLAQVHAPGEHQDSFVSRGSSEMQRAVSLTAAGKKEWYRDNH